MPPLEMGEKEHSGNSYDASRTSSQNDIGPTLIRCKKDQLNWLGDDRAAGVPSKS